MSINYKHLSEYCEEKIKDRQSPLVKDLDISRKLMEKVYLKLCKAELIELKH